MESGTRKLEQIVKYLQGQLAKHLHCHVQVHNGIGCRAKYHQEAGLEWSANLLEYLCLELLEAEDINYTKHLQLRCQVRYLLLRSALYSAGD